MDTETLSEPLKLSGELQEYLDKLVAAQVEKAVTTKLTTLSLPQTQAKKKPIRKVAIIASKGTLDMAYPPLILATAAAALGGEVSVFFTFYGLNILHKAKNATLQVAPIANPAMPVPIPNIIGMLPGMTPMATKMMKGMFEKHHVQTIPQLLKDAQELEVKLIACQMTMDVMGIKPEEFIEGVEIGGAATFLKFAFDADVSLFI
jgi:peroxiredoxin family protein